MSALVLAHADESKPFVISCDASDYGIGAELTQPHLPGRVLAYFSRKLNSAERNYSVGDRELLAIKDSCCRWRFYMANGM